VGHTTAFNFFPETKMSTSKASATPSAVDTKDQDFRLPRNVIPTNYRIQIEPDIAKKKFSGEVTIEVSVNEPVSTIVLNAKELEILEAQVSNSTGTRLVASVKLDNEREFAILTFSGVLGLGDWQLFVRFNGIHNDKLKGFYGSSWKDDDGKSHALVSTQFESTDARRAFPCFDEPDFKATYEVSLIVPKDLAAISNGRIVTETAVPNNKKLVRFKKTMKMSTYLVAFIVGEFEPSESVFVNGIELRSWAIPGKRHLTGFSLRAGAFAINYFEKYFRVKYPDADKCDLIAIPDFASGAMENKDCITFRETALLLDEVTATHAEKERVAEVVMHELAHMWFGDLVTMRWWNGLWLNEAFATFMATKCCDAFRKDWRVWDGFGIGRAAAARVDSLNSTHPIECQVNRPEETQELFDVISYQKGCSVLYQIEQFIGEEIFRNGISHYLNTHSFNSTETHDLWDSLEKACKQAGSNVPVREIMDKWVFLPGHPVLSVKTIGDDGFIEVEQQQFKFLNETPSNQIYPVPVRMKVKAKDGVVEEQNFLLDEKSKKIYVGEGYDWVVLNAGGSGFYRVRYDSALATKLTTKIKENLSVIERFNLVNDTWASVRSGLTPAAEYLDMIRVFSEEDDINVWSIITGSIHMLHSLLKGDERKALQQIIRDLYSPIANKLGWHPTSGEEAQTKQLRGSVHGVLGTVGEELTVRTKAAELFEQWKKDRAAIDSNILPAIVGILAYTGDDKRFEEFQKLSSDAKTPQETLRFLYALGGFRDVKLIKKLLDTCLSDKIRTQDAPFIIATAAGNEIASEPVWQFVKTNWEKIQTAFPENGIVRMCGAIVPTLDTAPLEKEVKDFFKAHKVKSGEMALAQALEQLRVNVSLRERETKPLGQHVLKRIAVTAK
jgi:puromycin-sensitive aminopeptidase